MAKAQAVVLPTTYYLQHFEYLLDFVQHHYGFLLKPTERAFICAFAGLSLNARCLFVRLTNRRGKYFRLIELNYAEIDVLTAVTELVQSEFILKLKPNHEVDFQSLLKLFTKSELLQFGQTLGLKIPKTLGRLELEEILRVEIKLEKLSTFICEQEIILQPLFEAETQILQFLFFGSLHADMTRFVVRDLGKVQLPNFSSESYSPRFSQRKELEDSLSVALAKQTFYDFQKRAEAELCFKWFSDWYASYLDLEPKVQPSLAKLVLRLGKFLEQANLPQQALVVYGLTAQAPSRERQARILKKLGQVETAEALCQQISLSPQNAAELYFTKDFLAKNLAKSALKSTTVYLANAKVVQVPKDRPEQAVMRYMQQQGYEVLYTENGLWRGLFGLLFWDIVYDSSLAILHQPLQSAPSDLYLPEFFLSRQQALVTRLGLLEDKAQCLGQLEKRFQTLYGVKNPMISWYEGLWEAITLCYARLSVKQLAAVLLQMAKDWRHNSCGFPDLFCWREADYHFIEVKSPNDQLSAQQLRWLECFAELEIPAEVVRISWQD